ncbi:MAG: DUF5915 domain-containing protein, partial [Trebonia sp.]
DDMSNWYVRRSRRRFWSGPATADGASAFATLHEALVAITKMMAPITPFLADYVWGVLRPDGEPESVHLASWPAFSPALIDQELGSQMALARRLSELGRSARSAAGIRTRQPLSRALADAPGFAALPESLRALIAEELNVRSITPLAAGSSGSVMTYTVKPQFRSLGKRFGPQVQAVAAALTSLDPASVATAVAAGSSVTLEVASLGTVSLDPSDVIVTQTPLEGWEVATASGETVALDLTVTPELRREGIAREVIRLIQDARKTSGLRISDRILVRWEAGDPEVVAALTAYAELISGEVLATEFDADGGPAGGGPAGGAATGWHEFADSGLGVRFWLTRA